MIHVLRSPSFSSLDTLAWTVGRGILVLSAMSWRFLRPYFFIAVAILTFSGSKNETKRLILSRYSCGAIWLKYDSKKIGGGRNFSRFCSHRDGFGSWGTFVTITGQQIHLI